MRFLPILLAMGRVTLEWVDWFNNRRLLEPIGDIPPPEFEQAYFDQLEPQAIAARLTQKSLRNTRGGSHVISLVDVVGTTQRWF